MAKKVLVKDNKVLSLHSGKVLGAPENYDLDTYLNFYMPFGGTITLRRVGSPTVVELEYSTDGGRTWTIWEEVDNDRTVELPAEGRVWIRNTSETSTRFNIANNSYTFVADKIIYAFGNIASLIIKTPANAGDTLPQYCFRNLFENLELATSPILPFKVLSRQCYEELFRGNHIISRVITKMTDATATNCTIRWLYDAYELKGDFYCPAELTIPTGTSGIPSGWTRHDLSELE